MAGVLAPAPRRGWGLSSGRVGAICMSAALGIAFYTLLHHLHSEGHNYIKAHPKARGPDPSLVIAMSLAFPVLTIACLVLMLPLLMYISFEADFRGLRPWLPHHYVRIARRTFSALANNRGKVTEKNL